jgi:hypothetical protein
MSTPTKGEFDWLNFASLDPKELHDEIAWGTINKMGWIASPELFFALKQYVRDIGLLDGQADSTGVPEQADWDDAAAPGHAPTQHSRRHSAG